jgi:hypothetical protein
VKTLVAYNCISEQRPLEMWVSDLTARTGFVDMGTLYSNWSDDGGCPEAGEGWTFTPTSGHEYLVESVDYSAPDCSNDPSLGQCLRSENTLTGDQNGYVEPITIG